MKILYVSPYAPARDGVGNYTSVLAAAVRGCGNETFVLAPRASSGTPDEVIGHISRRPRRAAALRKRISQFGPDIVHVQFSVGAFGSRVPALLRWIDALKRDLGVPVIVTMHEVTRDTALLRAIGRALYRRIAGSCDRVIVHTQAAKGALTDQTGTPPGKVTVIPHPAVEPPAQGVGPRELRGRFGLGEARILLAFGFIHVDKGLPDLVRALGLLRKSAALPPDLRVLLAGAVRRRNGPMRAFEAWDHLHLQRALFLARRHGVRDRLVLTGYVPDAEVAGWFAAAEAAVLPYRRIEQSGVASLAVALAVPVLTSQVGGLDEMFADGLWTFPARDPGRLAQVIAGFLDTPACGRSPARAGDAPAGLAAVAAATLNAYAVVTQDSSGGLVHVS